MARNKKGADHTSTPQGISPNKNKSNYSRLNNLCLLLIIIGLIVLFIAHFKDVSWAFYLGAGMGFSALVIQLEINALEMEEEDEDEEY